MKTVLGIDPGFDRMGIAVLRWEVTPTLLYSACFETPRTLSKSARLSLIREEVKKVIGAWKPTVLSLETLFFSTNKKTALGVSEARGVVREVAESCGVYLVEVSPQEVKLAATGHGRSAKREVIRMIPFLVKGSPKKALDDEYDAIAIALAGGARRQFPQVS
jgi:crossover junction endodeoxyribonuclease RuvC